MKLHQIGCIAAIAIAANGVEAATTLTVNAKLNCLNISTAAYLPGGGPAVVKGLAYGKYVVEVQSSNADYGGGNLPVKEALIWYGSNIPGSTTWFQSVRIGVPIVIDHNPEYALYAMIPDLYCENNTGSTILTIRQVAP